MDEFQNFNLQDIVTPIDVAKLNQLLIQSGYDRDKTRMLVQGFSSGFDIGYRGLQKRKDQAQNLPFNHGDKLDMWKKIMKEVKLGRYAGPYLTIPFKYYIQSPIGLVPKAGGRTRLIFHLSYDFGEHEWQKLFNYHTPDELCSVKYCDLDYAIRSCLALLGRHQGLDGSSIIYYAKADLLSAFRILPARPDQRKFLCMYAKHPVTNQKFFFVERI